MKKNERNYWPHVVVISICLVAIACGVTVKIALDNPVELDTTYFEKYGTVDKNINSIQLIQKEFDSKYTLSFLNKKFQVGTDSSIALLLENNNGTQIQSNAKVDFLLTKPETNSYNQKYSVEKAENGIYLFSPINIEKRGRWVVQARVTVGNLTGFITEEMNVTN